MRFRILRERDYSEAETHGIKCVDVLQQLWVEEFPDGSYAEFEWRGVPIVEAL